MATTTTNQVEALQDRVADLERDMGALKAMLAERDAELQDARAQTAAARGARDAMAMEVVVVVVVVVLVALVVVHGGRLIGHGGRRRRRRRPRRLR